MAGSGDLLLAFYGDDFTGSTDALEFLERAGVRTVLFLEPPSPERLARYPGRRAVGVAGVTRALPPEAMEAALRPAFSQLRALGVPHVHYKVCSTFDSSPTIGSIGRAIDVGAEIFGARFVPLLVGTPPLGRYCVFGNLFARMGIGSGGAIHRLDRHPVMSRHPITPAKDSDLRRHLSLQTNKRIGLFDVLQVALPAPEAAAALGTILAEGAEVVLFDVLAAGQFERLGGLIDGHASRERPLFSAGSSGIEGALTAHWKAQGRLTAPAPWVDPGPAGPMLIVSGSCSAVNEKQIAWGLSQGMAEVPLDTATLAAGGSGASALEEQAAAAAAASLKAGRSVIVHSAAGPTDPRVAATAAVLARRGLGATAAKAQTARLFGAALGRIARLTLEQASVRRLLIIGGDTSGYAAQALGIEAMEMIAPLAAGMPICRVHAPGSPADQLEANFKGGQVGAEDYFDLVAQGRAR
jgi:3-oxoisoapionate kinase